MADNMSVWFVGISEAGNKGKGKSKGKGMGTCSISLHCYDYSMLQRFTVSEVGDDWRELTVPQRIIAGYPLSALTNSGTRGAASRHTTAQSLTQGLHLLTHATTVLLISHPPIVSDQVWVCHLCC